MDKHSEMGASLRTGAPPQQIWPGRIAGHGGLSNLSCGLLLNMSLYLFYLTSRMYNIWKAPLGTSMVPLFAAGRETDRDLPAEVAAPHDVPAYSERRDPPVTQPLPLRCSTTVWPRLSARTPCCTMSACVFCSPSCPVITMSLLLPLVLMFKSVDKFLECMRWRQTLLERPLHCRVPARACSSATSYRPPAIGSSQPHEQNMTVEDFLVAGAEKQPPKHLRFFNIPPADTLQLASGRENINVLVMA